VQPASAAAIDRFLDAVWIEEGLAANTLAAYRRDLTLFARWQAEATSDRLTADETPARAVLDNAEEVLRHQRGALDRMHQLWIEYAQLSGLHAPQ